jgi:hypothetical protein
VPERYRVTAERPDSAAAHTRVSRARCARRPAQWESWGWVRDPEQSIARRSGRRER